MPILVATDLSTRSHRALRRAGLLARASGTSLTLAHVVDEDRPAGLIALETREAGRILNEQIAAVPELQGLTCQATVISGDPYAGLLRAAEAANAALIVMGAHRRQLLRDVFIGTTVERVIRAAAFPVLMVNGEVEGPYRSAAAAVGMSEPCAEAIRTAQRLKLLDEAKVTIAHAFSPPGQVMMFYAGLDRGSISAYVASARRRAEAELAAFVSTQGFDHRTWSFQVAEGMPSEVLKSVVKARRPDLLIMGTHARAGLARALLGSVAEEALRSLDVDILTVPPTVRAPDRAAA
jgi:nucleotide-binding universal stress UspA family protein